MNRLCMSVVLIVLAALPAVPSAWAQESKYAAVTAADPNVPADDLGLLLKPLRKQELVVEAEAWLALLQAKVRQISQAEIQVREQSRGVAVTKQEAGAAAGQQTKAKEQLLAGINKLREEQTALLDRVQVAIEALRAKGGEVGEYEKYAAAVSGLSVDVKDISATRAMVIGWLKSPEGGLRWVKMIVAFVLILGASQVAASLLGRLTRRAVAMNKKCSDLFKDFLVNVVHKVVLVMGLVIALSVLGINVGPLVAGIGALGFIVGFALQGTLGNFAAGMMILLHRPYDVGDVVNTAGITGVVQSMSLNTTTIKTFDNQIVVIPNGSIWGNNITNVTGSDTRRVDMTFGIGYGDDQAKAQRILESIVSSHALVLKDPAPTIKLHELGDSSVNFVCRPWTQTANYWTVYWDITRSVKERFDAEGISIPFPQRDVHVYHETVEPASLSKALQKGLGGKTAVGADDDRA